MAEAYGRDAPARLVESGRVALVLDGFDEIADDLRPAAIHALDQHALFRLMVLTRTRELIDAVAGGHLHGAAALELLPVPANEAADYLLRCQVQPPQRPGNAWPTICGRCQTAQSARRRTIL